MQKKRFIEEKFIMVSKEFHSCVEVAHLFRGFSIFVKVSDLSYQRSENIASKPNTKTGFSGVESCFVGFFTCSLACE